jgi:glycosyltransferase involved in cell wall biosynthesis
MISVLVATHNGSITIGRFLDALAALEPPCCNWEVVVVDNGSTDDTMEVLRRYEKRLPLHIFEQPIRGKNRALNEGLKYVRGDVIVLTDDDVLPDRQWLIKIWESTSKNPDSDLFGGRILPFWERYPPRWLESAIPFSAAFGITPPDLKAGPIEPGRIWGGNMFVRRRVFEAGFRFNEQVGPSVGNYIMGGEIELTLRIAAAGYSTCWCPDVQVRHIISKEQLTRKWLLRRAYRHGKSIFFQNPGYERTERTCSLFGKSLNFPRFIIRQAIDAFLSAAVRDIMQDAPGALRQWWRFFHFAGYMEQSRHVDSEAFGAGGGTGHAADIAAGEHRRIL